MAVSREEFRQAFIDVGGHETYSLVDRGKLLLRRMGARSLQLAELDAYDAIELVKQGMTTNVHTVQRMFVRMEHRYAALMALDELGVNGYDRYVQTDASGKQWTQLTLSADPEFRAYAATRRLLDGTYEEDSIVEVSEADLHLAVTGEPLETDER